MIVSRVDFYVLSASGELARLQFACRLAEKAYKLNNRVHIHVTGGDAAAKLDDLLWTFRDGSFVPHELLAGAPEPEAPVTIGSDVLPSFDCDLLINLGDTVPAQANAFPRVAEIVTSDEDSRSRSRKRFVAYRDDGHALETHNL